MLLEKKTEYILLMSKKLGRRFNLPLELLSPSIMQRMSLLSLPDHMVKELSLNMPNTLEQSQHLPKDGHQEP